MVTELSFMASEFCPLQKCGGLFVRIKDLERKISSPYVRNAMQITLNYMVPFSLFFNILKAIILFNFVRALNMNALILTHFKYKMHHFCLHITLVPI